MKSSRTCRKRRFSSWHGPGTDGLKTKVAFTNIHDRNSIIRKRFALRHRGRVAERANYIMYIKCAAFRPFQQRLPFRDEPSFHEFKRIWSGSIRDDQTAETHMARQKGQNAWDGNALWPFWLPIRALSWCTHGFLNRMMDVSVETELNIFTNIFHGNFTHCLS